MILNKQLEYLDYHIKRLKQCIVFDELHVKKMKEQGIETTGSGYIYKKELDTLLEIYKTVSFVKDNGFISKKRSHNGRF